MPKAWTHGPTKENWEQQKSASHRLYIVNDLTLQGVLSELTKLGLNATKPQLEYKLKKWGFRKNLSQGEWRSINRETTKRKFEDKETDLIYSGKRLKSGTIEKARLRYGSSKHVVSDNSAFVLPQELTICTPPPMSIESSGWPETLPWLTFVSKQDAFLKNVSNRLHARFLSSSRSSTAETEPSQSLARILPTRLIPERSRSAPLQLAAVFAKYMPETHDDEHVQRAQAIIKGHGEAYVLEHLKLMVYHVSNNLFDFDAGSFNSDNGWHAVVSMLREGGILDIKLDIKTTQDETLLAFFETLFRQALRKANVRDEILHKSGMEVLKWLLKSGIDPDQQTCFSRIPLQFCLDYGGGDLNVLRLLLESGANPSLVKLDCRYPGCSYYYMKARFLFERGAVADSLDELLHLALLNKDLDFASRLISRHNADPASILQPVYSHVDTLYEANALCVAAETGMEEVNFVLRHLHLRYPSVPPLTFITPDAYIVAACRGSEDVTRLFLELNPAALCANNHGITALHVALQEGHYGVCHLLLARLSGAAFPQLYPTPLHLAIRKDQREVVQLLIENGADINSKGTGIISKYVRYWEKPRTPLQEAMQHFHSSCVDDLLSAGADYSGVDICMAAKSGNQQLIFLVLTAGAHPDLKDNGSAIVLQRILRADHECVLGHPKFKALAWSFLDTEAQLLGGEVVGAIRRGWWDIVASLTANRSLIDTDMYGRTTIEEAIMSASCLPKFMDDVFEAYQYSYEPGSLCAAVWDKNLPFVKRILASRPETTPPNTLESTALGLAAALGLSEIVKELLAVLPISPALIPLDWETGVRRIQNETVSTERDALVFWKEKREWVIATGSPLALAASTSSPALFSSLLEHGYQSDLLTWLACAENKTTEMLELLLNHGQRISRNDTVFYEENRVSNPLSIAIYSPMAQQTVKFLLRAGAHENASWIIDNITSFTPLHKAIEKGNTDVISELLKVRAYVNASGKVGDDVSYTPLYLAIVRGNKEVVSELLKAGADTNAHSTTMDGEIYTSLHLAIEKGNKEVISELLKAGADTNAHSTTEDGNIYTPLHLAIEKGNKEVIGELLKAGADVNARQEREHETALQLAVKHGDMDIISNLLKAGADINASPGEYRGATAIQFAAMNGHIGLAKHLLELGALVNAPRSPSLGRTALEGAAECGRLDMVRLLLEKGALVHNRGRRQYVRAVGFAIKRGHLVVAELLKAHGDWADSDQQMLERDYRGHELNWGERLWGDDIGQMPQTDEEVEIIDLTEEMDSPEETLSTARGDSAAFEKPEDCPLDAPTTVAEVVEDSNAPNDDGFAFAVHSWVNGELPQSTTT